MNDKLALAGISLLLFSITFITTSIQATRIFSVVGLLFVIGSLLLDGQE